jgi:hypothetical protein
MTLENLILVLSAGLRIAGELLAMAALAVFVLLIMTIKSRGKA